MTDTANQPTDDSKEELTEAELDQVAGGIGAFGVAMAEKKHAQPEVLGNKNKDGSVE
jgi:ABC-type phosphate transport system substrate-binding protein